MKRGKEATTVEADRLDERLLLKALRELKKGDFSVRLPLLTGVPAQIAEEFNQVVDLNEGRAHGGEVSDQRGSGAPVQVVAGGVRSAEGDEGSGRSGVRA